MNKHNSKEAFCLMQYQCENCGYVEFLWNSRDGVTPFVISSKCCEAGRMSHINFGSDKFYEELPKLASRVFISMTHERAVELAHLKFDDHGEKMMEQYPHLKEIGKEKLIEGSIKEIYREGENPDIISRLKYLSLIALGEQHDS